MPRPCTVAYFTMGFPVTSETAVIREMYALRQDGFDLHVFAARTPDFSGVFEPKAMTFKDVAQGATPALGARGLARVCAMASDGHPGAREVLEVTLGRAGKMTPKALVMMAFAAGTVPRIQALGIEYVHGNFASLAGYAAWVVHKLTGIPFGFTMHAHDLFIHDFLIKEKLKDAALPVSISRYNLAYLKARWGIERPDAPIVHCGVDVGEFKPDPRPPSRELRALSIGRLTPMKGFAYLIDAMGLLTDLPLSLTIVGHGEDKAALEAQVQTLGLSGRVQIRSGVGQEELRRLLQEAHVYVQPSIRLPDGLMEGVPATLMEAGAMALPSVATRLSGMGEVVLDGQTGLLVDPGDCTRLAQALRYLATHPEEAAAMGRRARAHVEAQFDADTNARILGAHIRRVLQQGSRP